MPNSTDLHLPAVVLARYGLPDIAYPAPTEVRNTIAEGDDLPVPALLYALQQRTGAAGKDWQQFEAALDRLAALLNADDGPEIVAVPGSHWWLELGPVDLNDKVITIQRDDTLIAAIAPRSDGRLRVSTFRPLDGKSLAFLTGLARHPHPDGTVCLRENNWEYALDCSASIGNQYGAEQGEAYLSFWEQGIGILWNGTEHPVYRPYRDLPGRSPGLAAAELRVHDALSPAPEPVAPVEVAPTTATEPIDLPR